MWVIDQMTPGNPAYNVPNGYRLRGPLDVMALEDSFNEVIKRHEALRTTFGIKDGEPLQFIHPELKINLNVTELNHLSDEESENRLQALASEESVKPFNLSRLPLIRASLFKLAEAEHVLIINVHHIAADGLSIRLLLEELDTFYRAFTRGGGPRPPELAVQYADFALWQRQTIANEAAYANQIEFWQKQLGGTLPVLELPGNKPRPTLQSFNGSNIFFNIPAALVQDLSSLGAREGCTFFMTLLAAFQVLLQRYSRADDIVIGTPVAARTPHEVEPLIGNFLTMVALRCDVSGDPTFIELLGRSRDTALNAFSHSDLPFEPMMKHLKFKRDPSRNPIFQVVLQVLSTMAPRIGGLEVTSFHFDLGFAQFDLSLQLYEDVGGYLGRFEYCTDLFEAQTIQRLCGHYRILLEAIVREPHRRVSTLPLLTDAERQQAISGWNKAIHYPKGACLHERLERQVELTPDAVALVYEEQRISYAELNRRANRLAHRLRELGVTPDQLVGLRIDRSVEMVIGIVGILKSGGAYLPLDPAYPRDRVTFMLEDSHVAIVVTQKNMAVDLEGIAVTHVLLDEPLTGPDTNPAPASTADHLAYVIYTSGSTGKPKGALITHYNVTRLFEATDQWYHFDHHDVWTLFHSYAFDFSVWELWGALLYGGRVVIVPYWVSRVPEDFRELLVRERVTVLNQTPSAFRQLIQAELSAAKTDLALRYVIFGGEALELQSLRPWFQRYGDAQPQLVNMYGITETTVHVTYRPIRLNDLESGLGSVIGIPIPDLQVYILDPTRQPLPIGVPGEMYVGGAGVARGYLNRAELTATRFIPDPFLCTADATLYRTGDLARRLENGDIEYLGRIDHQVKIRGFRVELGEIEAALAEHADVRQAAVHLWTVKPDDVRIIACCVPGQPGMLTPISLRKHLRARLPEYMIPQNFLLMDEIPLTPNGKVDRRRLPTPVVEESRLGRHETPSDPVEATIAEIWTKLIGPARPISRVDKFFEMGGHSLLGVQALRQIEDKLGVRLEFRVLFQESLAEIAARCRPERIAG